jgi:hypothetical protein
LHYILLKYIIGYLTDRFVFLEFMNIIYE